MRHTRLSYIIKQFIRLTKYLLIIKNGGAVIKK